MFTGIITDIGRVAAIDRAGESRFRIDCAYDPASIAIGASIACSGVCLTVIDRGAEDDQNWFEVEASQETLDKTTLGDWAVGTRINLERALRVGDELGGHIVTGHVDGVAVLDAATPVGESLRLDFNAPDALAKFIAPKGSVTLDGASLTVNTVDGARFAVNIIPHTRAATTLGNLAPGTRVNLEIDVLARYVARLNDMM